MGPATTDRVRTARPAHALGLHSSAIIWLAPVDHRLICDPIDAEDGDRDFLSVRAQRI